MSKPIFIIRISLSIFLLSTYHVATASSRAVRDSNYQFDFNSADTYISGNRASYYYLLGLTANYPIAQYLGASISTHYGATTLLPGTANALNTAQQWSQCVYHSTGYAANLFARLPDVGRIGIGYARNRLNSQCQASFIATGTNSLYSDSYSADAEYYFQQITLAASWTHTRISNNVTLISDSLGIAWYPTHQSRFRITVDGEGLKNTYDFDVEYQPDFLGDRLGISFNYINQRQAITDKTYIIGLHYYFDTSAELLERDRDYR